MTKKTPILIVLASGSPRRRDLLKDAGIHFSVLVPEVNETPLPKETPKALVKRLSLSKAEAAAVLLVEKSKSKFSQAILIAADTIVVAPHTKKILGKPTSAKEAAKMLGSICGNTHEVLTGYCILQLEKTSLKNELPQYSIHTVSRVVSSKVKMRALTPKQIKAYIKTGEPHDKAGAYAAQGLGMTFIDSINGSYTNVVGLPMSQLLCDLENHFKIIPQTLHS